MCPEAEPDDGLFDVLLIGDVTKRDLAFVAAEDLQAASTSRTRRLELLRGSAVTVDADGAAPDRARRRAAGNDAGALRDRAARAAPARSRELLGGPAWRLAPGGRLRLLERRDLLLELRDARFERVDPAHLLRESSTRVRRSFTAVSAFWPPGRSARRWSASSPASASRVTKSFSARLRLLRRGCRHADSHSIHRRNPLVTARRRPRRASRPHPRRSSAAPARRARSARG